MRIENSSKEDIFKSISLQEDDVLEYLVQNNRIKNIENYRKLMDCFKEGQS